jgi:nucleotidyltransferase/DNA polymerase involved in DNA repair
MIIPPTILFFAQARHNKQKHNTCATLVRMRIIGHLDMDAFFAAVEERNNPRFQGLPLVVGADPKDGAGRGVVSTANYAARKLGIHSAMPITRAWQRSQAAIARGRPAAIFLSGSFSAYDAISRRLMAIIKQHAPTMQQRSIDEAYFDLSHASPRQAVKICRAIKQEIKEKEQLTASIGLGPNKLIAKIASDHDKPDGLTVIASADVEAFLDPLPIRAIPGIGPKTEAILKQQSICVVRDLKKLRQQALHDRFGKWGDVLYEKARGRDSSPLREEHIAKSIGHNLTFSRDTLNAGFLIPKLAEACQDVFERLTGEGFSTFRVITITVRFADFQTKTRRKTIPKPSSSAADLRRVAMQLFLPFLDHRENPQEKLIRLIGVRLEKIT